MNYVVRSWWQRLIDLDMTVYRVKKGLCAPLFCINLYVFQGISPVGILDITNPNTTSWLNSKLEKLVEYLRVDPSFMPEEATNNALLPLISFYLDTGTYHDLPTHFEFYEHLENPDLFRDRFVAEVMSHHLVVGVSGVTQSRPKAPAYLFMKPLSHTWDDLRSIIPNALHLSTAGYPFFNPGPIGGDVKDSELDFELFARWWQLNTFLPITHFQTLPSELPFEKVN